MTTITNNKLTDECVSNATLIRLIQWADQHNSHYVAAALCELQERRKAERGSEPVAWTDAEELSDLKRDGYAAMISLDRKDCEHADPRRQILLFTHPAPARQRDQIRREHAEWSDKTFGDVGPIGPLKHLSKEALEAAADPSDPLEWANMQFLLWDAQRRAGITDKQITRAMVEKLAVNKKREWPEPKDGEPRLHIKGQSAPVVPDGLRQALSNAGIAAPESDEMLAATCEKYIQMLVTWVKDRKPFQPVPVVPEEITDESTEQRLMGRRWAHSFCAGWNACRAAMLQSKYRDLSQPVDPQISEYEKIMLRAGNSPVIPDGYALVPVEPTDEMIVAAMDSDDVTYNESDDTVFYVHHCEIYKAMLAAAPQPEENNE